MSRRGMWPWQVGIYKKQGGKYMQDGTTAQFQRRIQDFLQGGVQGTQEGVHPTKMIRKKAQNKGKY